MVTPGSELVELAWWRPPWQADAACREHPDVDFFPERGDWRAMDAALAVCAGCLVRAECASFALDYPPSELHGVWGGMSANQRAAERRRRSKEVA